MGVVLALLSAVVWGSGDFAGGLASRKVKSLHVLVGGGVAALLLLTVLAVLRREPLPGTTSIGWTLAAGAAGMIGLMSLYRALSIGRASVVAPVSTIVTDVIPVLYTMFTVAAPKPLQWLGFAVAMAGIWLISQEDLTPSAGKYFPTSRPPAPRTIGLKDAVIAGLGFGAFFVFIGWTDPGTTFGSLAIARLTTVLLSLLLITLQRDRVTRKAFVPLTALAGVLDAGGNALYLISLMLTRPDVAAVLSSLYPVSTIVLSSIILKERLARFQWVGVGVCAVAVALIVA
jgi:drug/metabolite transporter (DMT)-like permease